MYFDRGMKKRLVVVEDEKHRVEATPTWRAEAMVERLVMMRWYRKRDSKEKSAFFYRLTLRRARSGVLVVETEETNSHLIRQETRRSLAPNRAISKSSVAV